MTETSIQPRPRMAVSPKLDHAVGFTIQGDDIEGTMTCSASVGAPCRMTCAASGVDGCESWDTDEGSCSHGLLVDVGYCQAVEWVDATSLLEQHAGGEPAVVGDGPVEVWWDEEGWRWAYPGHAPNETRRAT